MPVDESRFRQLMGHFASGVTVVTTEYEGQLFGLTVSSFCSLSLHPPLVLICIDKKVRAHDAIAAARRYAVNILEKHQEYLSRRFATPEIDKFIGVAWRFGQLGLPILEGTLASFECRLTDTFPGGDHSIFVGEVQNGEIREGSPLIYYRRGYHELR
ncbi:MAG: flavin reductase family protein [Roseiflexus sp.]|nr:flavin reductase family protein [Roseiflexus sp.]MCS7288862.1 flavin reductase family protein [Roseiflexus sp.]MDW8146952.1 flavin reductase family protein [Roseiflexaceae bacterium]MDW8234363.1 flavin reductase family protein [Roseiflexaceae bacterium]